MSFEPTPPPDPKVLLAKNKALRAEVAKLRKEVATNPLIRRQRKLDLAVAAVNRARRAGFSMRQVTLAVYASKGAKR